MIRRYFIPLLVALALGPGTPAAHAQTDPPELLPVLEITNTIIWQFHVEVFNRECIRFHYSGDCATPFFDQPFYPIYSTNRNRFPSHRRRRSPSRFSIFNERIDTIPTHGRYYLDSAKLYFPLLADTMQAQWDPARLTSKITFQPIYKSIGKLLPKYDFFTKPTIVDVPSKGYRYGVWETPAHATEAFIFNLTIPVRAHSLRFDEQAAMQVPWPAQWPEQTGFALQPQPLVESDDPLFADLVKQWLGNPKQHNPAMSAKILMGKLVDAFQPNGFPVDWNTPLPSSIRGLIPMYSTDAADQMQGSSIDMSAVLVGLYRAAGIPSRVVIGYDIGASAEGPDLPFRDDFEDCALVTDETAPSNPLVRGWVEFYLYDFSRNQGVWVPVDPYRQKLNSSRVPSVDVPWKFFGNFPCGAIRIPMTHHIVSPYADVADVWPASFLSWDASPAPIPSTQYTIISAMEIPRRAGEPVWPDDSP